MGDRLTHLRDALVAIETFAEIVAVSSVYETAPVGGPSQGHFLNAAARLRYDETPEGASDEPEPTRAALALLDRLLAVEQTLGRVRVEHWGPRTIDLDVLHVDGMSLKTPRLVVPHPRLEERAFALAPLFDVYPDAPYVKPHAPPGPVVASGAWWR